MTSDDPFEDLGQTLEDESDDVEQVEERNPTKDTAFTYDEANQRPFYAREAIIEDFDSWLNYELERELSNRDYQNIVVREMTDALLRTVVEEDLVDEVAERFEQARENTGLE